MGRVAGGDIKKTQQISMKESTKMIKRMVMEFSHGQAEIFIKETTRMTRGKAPEK